MSAIQNGKFINGNFENFKALLDRGTVLNAIKTSTHYHRSHLVRGRLESSCEVTIKLTKGECTKTLLERYDKLLHNL